MKRKIVKIFRPGERVMLKLDRAPDKYRNKIAIVQDPPYLHGRSVTKKPYLNVRWEDGTPEKWLYPGRYFKRVPVPRRSLMPDTRKLLETMASIDLS